MKKITFLFVLFLNGLLFANPIHKVTILNPVIIEITDVSLDAVNYYSTSYAVPTKLVFTNLTTVTGDIAFHINANLVEVEFPVLTQVGGFVYFHQNPNLTRVDLPLLASTGSYFYSANNQNLITLNIPSLNTVSGYIYVAGNTSLTTLPICGLTNILPGQFNPQPYYNISNNTPSIDATPLCFSLGGPQNLVLSNNTISENLPIDTVIGTLSADSSYPNGTLNYYLVEEFDFRFRIVGNQLRTKQTFDFEATNQYTVSVGVFNQLGENTTIELTINISNLVVENFTTIEITDATLENVFYHQVSFSVPTKLVFTNLTSVSGYVYFHQNPNLIGVDFPVLTQTGRYFYVSGNQSLESVKAPILNTVHDYLYVAGNTALIDLQVCNLANILSGDELVAPYYYIQNNTPIVDVSPPCFSNGGTPQNLALSNNTVSENVAPNTLVGTLTADNNSSNGTLTYYINDSVDFNNIPFTIVGNQLFTSQTFDYEAINQYTLTIGVRNQLGEELESDFTINISDISVEPITTIEITDISLENVFYHQVNFTQPTKLVFTNLTSVTGYVFFYKNPNLVGVEFPQLTQTGRYFYADANLSLVNIQAPVLSTIHDYLYISRNSSLTTLNVCNLSEILATDVSLPSYYYIQNNPLLDMSTTCLTNTIVSFNPINPIIVLPAPNTLIGTFSSDATGPVTYFFVDADGNQITNPNFIIIGNGLYLANEYNTYTESDFIINIGAIRTAVAPRSTVLNLNNNSTGLNEKIQLVISFNIENATLGVTPIKVKENAIVIYPNPASQNFAIQSNENIKEVLLFDMLGRQLKNLKISNNQVDVSNIPTGNYLAVIKTESGITATQKLMITK